MNDILLLATSELEGFLRQTLPAVREDWWQKCVVDRLSFQQQRHIEEQGGRDLRDLDLAALLRVLDQNWYDLQSAAALPREARSWVKELQVVRNKWAHRSSRDILPDELYRDADTLYRLLAALGATAETIAKVEDVKVAAIAQLAARQQGLQQQGGDVQHDNALSMVAASEEATSFAPMALFAVGELVCLRSNPAIVMPVIEVLASKSGETRYRVFQNSGRSVYYESQLQAVAVNDDERMPLTIEQLHAQLTSLQLMRPSTTSLYSLRTGRVKFVPYQYRPVTKLIRADRPRLLVADEVGVGKTIEAGLIIKELRARVDLGSVLVICPKALVAERKWFVEMKRFDEHFTPLDGPLLRHCINETDLEGEWPDQYAKAIVPFSLFDSGLLFGGEGRRSTQQKGLLALDPPPKFDLVIVDEAHHIRNAQTFLHQGIRYFCDNAEAVVFLTATPVQLGSEDLYTLLNVLRPDLIIDQSSFGYMAEPNSFINHAVYETRSAKPGWAGRARANLGRAAETEWGRLFLRESPEFQRAYDLLAEESVDDVQRVGLTRTIEELYTFSSLINRTRRRDIGEFTVRKPETLEIAFTGPQQQLHDRLLEIIAEMLAFYHGSQNVKFLMTTIRRQAASCLYGLVPLLHDILNGKLDRLEAEDTNDGDGELQLGFVETKRGEIAELLGLARNLDAYDPKAEAFIRVLSEKQELSNNKALVFSTFRHTLAYLAGYLAQTRLRFGVVHGGVPDDERSELRRRFALPKADDDALDVLLSSEVGCEGLDFQFCDFLINYDLPWNPMRIEQRIGRIDRYGQQSEAIAIVNFITPGTVDADIYDRCLWRIGVFQHAVGGNEEILGEIAQQLHAIVENFELTSGERQLKLEQLADNEIRRLQEDQELESRQVELFGLQIPGSEWDEFLASAESYWLTPAALQGCVAGYLQGRLDTEQEYLLGERAMKTLRLSQDARNKLLDDFRRLPKSTEPEFRAWEKWLKGTTPTLQVTFEQESAAEVPAAMHLSVTHPLVRQAATYHQTDTQVYAKVAVRRADVQPGHYPFAIYRWTKHGVKRDTLLTPIALEAAIEDQLFDLLQQASTAESVELPDDGEFERLDERHQIRWRAAQATHIADNRQLVDHRIHSLAVSHRARRATIEDQIANTTNLKIRLMRESELKRADADFERRIAEFERAAESGDIHTTPVVFGLLVVEN